jgi:glutamate-1-semialdehyde aminotransferase
VRIARAATGRDLFVKVEGSYHGSPDGLAFSYWVERRADRTPAASPNTTGVPAVYGDVLRIVPYNDLEAVERVFADGEGGIQFRRGRVSNFQEHLETNSELGHLAWLYQLNGGVFPPAGDPWTFSVARTDDHLARYVENFATFAGDVSS